MSTDTKIWLQLILIAFLVVMVSNQLSRIERLLRERQKDQKTIEYNYQLDLWKQYRAEKGRP